MTCLVFQDRAIFSVGLMHNFLINHSLNPPKKYFLSMCLKNSSTCAPPACSCCVHSCRYSFIRPPHARALTFYCLRLLQYSCVPLVRDNRLRGNTADVAPRAHEALIPDATQCEELIDKEEEEWGTGEGWGDGRMEGGRHIHETHISRGCF